MNQFSAARSGALLLVAVSALSAFACEPVPPREPKPSPEPGAEPDPDLPGVAFVDEALQERLDRALAAQGPAYAPRTHHLNEDGSPRFTNRLIRESSPYLLQHAHNPVNWYAWSDEAFERAKRENKPVFLSVGYSTCHWCHVMERESFEDEEIAAYLNGHFIAIKVDREERPDIDSVYMTAVTILTGRGGWPMTVIMTPDKEPFFGGTYFPPRKGVRGNRAGLIDILDEMVSLYRDEPVQVVARAQELSQRVEQAAAIQPGPGVPSDKVIAVAAQNLGRMFDPVDGGFGGAPKFPQPSRLSLLLRYARRTRDAGATAMVATTLDRMAAGGIYDQIGGGFHRYSTDARWLVPHFEKMLYDNAQLAVVYLEAWQHTGDPAYQRVAREILEYVSREMTSPDGGFYSATDADSPTPSGHDEEGWFFTWRPDELEQLLGTSDSALVSSAYGVTERGNFEGRNILHRAKSDQRLASELGLSPKRVAQVIGSARSILYEARASRPPPIRDEKIIAAWNGMMAVAFAKAGWILAEPRYFESAARSARFVLEKMRDEDGALVRTYRAGNKGSASFLDDYAFMVAACLDLYQASGDAAWIERAVELQTDQDLRYLDEQAGGYYLTAAGGEALLVREKPVYDRAVPSGNSVSANNLLRLHDFTGDPKWRRRAERLFASLAFQVTRSPMGFPLLLVALDRYYDSALEVAVIAPVSREEAAELSERLRRSFVPNKVFTVLSNAEVSQQEAMLPWLEAKRAMSGKSTAYVCERGRCELPTSKPNVFQKQLDQRKAYPSFAETTPPRLPFERAKQ
ncbi:MAG: thioredoxin domain-containing protein [Deltaproteobacteria bacterium]|nr:thioredoxin domain-containing protein [Deltaproteobacteria bacterium]MBT8483853.1 thioredoxin domain-containing protein [Deltaproteobacteria bacterium]NNL26712.1 thioredoxin domain-containing protein [Myxococcales bacterium]